MNPMVKIILFVFSGGIIGVMVYRLIDKLWDKSAASSAASIRDDAKKEAEHILREAKVAAKSEALKIREEYEQEAKERRQEILTLEKRLNQREENIEKKADALDSRIASIERREEEVESTRDRLSEKEKELASQISRQVDQLENIAGMSRDEARNILLEKLKGEVQNEAGQLIRTIQEETRQRSEKEAQKIMIQAMQRYASDCTNERTTSTIPLPSDDMKGRIIGRDGRNIRAIEAETGVNLLIDDTPEAVVISCFDPVRKEVARQLLIKLIDDGRIHPTRIEELLKKVRKEVDEDIFSAGEEAVLETGVQGLPANLVRLLGRLKYRYSYSQNVLKHSLETSFFMGIIAGELGLDVQKAKRIGLLHDIGKAVDHEAEGSHASIGAELLRKQNEPKDIVNAVAAHHEEVDPLSPYAILVNACDALSASRPGARSETAELYLKRLEQLEDIAHSFSGVINCFALQAGRELRVVVEPDKINDNSAQGLARDICERVESEMNYPGQIKVSVIRETRSVHYAK